MKKLNKITLVICLIITICCVSMVMVACDKKNMPSAPTDPTTPTNPSNPSNPDDEGTGEQLPPLEVTHTSYNILQGTVDETVVHKFVSNRKGPTILIVGGTHGDEVAGWTAATQLVDTFQSETLRRNDMIGTVYIVPKFNKNADAAKKRYLKSYQGVPYSDLNRAFPTGRLDNAAKATIKMANAMVELVSEINPDYLVDLHESLESCYDNPIRLGDSIITVSDYFVIEEILIRYNTHYKKSGERDFGTQPGVKDGSFCKHFSTIYPDKIIFTIETNRKFVDGVDTIPLNIRVRQQVNILNSMFDCAWSSNAQ